jgi:hypothetical protein
MAELIEFPPRRICPTCGVQLRPATRSEINADLSDPRYSFVAESAAQGSHNWEPPNKWPEWRKAEALPAAWLLRCPSCDLRELWSRERG